ncbi:MAG: hypothetical protein AAF389_04570 [Gemmatimonadota bacterium]
MSVHAIRAAGRSAAQIFALLLVAACSAEAPTEPGAATISIRLEPAAATTTAGSTVDVTGFATVGGSFAGTVTFAVSGLPAGVSVSVGSVVAPTGGGDTFSVPISVDVGGSVPAGTYSGTVTATGSGVSAETTYSLTVAEPTAGSVTVSGVTDATIQQGSSDSRTVDITRSGGFSGDVTIAIEGVPAGVTAVASPVTTDGPNSTITIEVGGSAATGTSTLTVRATADGLPDATTTFQLTVTAPPSGSNITFDYSECVADDQPLWVAMQDGAGTGAWTRVNGVGDVYTFPVGSSTFGLALVMEVPGQTDVLVSYWGVAELGSGLVDACPPISSKTVNGNASGVVGFTNLSFGSASTPVFFDGPFSLGNVPAGVQDLVGYSAHNSGGSDRMIIDRDLDVADGGSVGTVDFSGGFIPGSATITLDGLSGAESGFMGMDYAHASAGSTCAVSPLYSGLLPSGGAATFEAKSAPALQQAADEYHVVNLTSTLGSRIKFLKEAFATLDDRTVAMPTDVPMPTISDAGGTPYLRLQAAYALDPEFDRLTSFSYSGGTNGVILTAHGSAMSPNVDFTMPDLTAVDGWDNAWGIPASTTGVDYVITATGLSSLEPLCTDGGRQIQSSLTGTYN